MPVGHNGQKRAVKILPSTFYTDLRVAEFLTALHFGCLMHTL